MHRFLLLFVFATATAASFAAQIDSDCYKRCRDRLYSPDTCASICSY